jgi:hypothetical protein
MKQNYRYGNYDGDDQQERDEPLNNLKIANSRGKKPVVKDIEKARGLIANLMIELNPCDAKEKLKVVDKILWDIIHDNQ